MTLPNFAFKNTHYDVFKGSESMNMNDTIFLFLCTLLVWLMTPGLSLLWGTRTIKNALNTVMQSMVAIVIVTFVWIIIGFSLSFDGGNQWIGGLKFWVFIMLVLKLQNFESSYPALIYVVSNDVLYNCGIYFIRFDCREMRFIPYLIFVSLWVLLIYSPVAHWVWGGGWISKIEQ